MLLSFDLDLSTDCANPTSICIDNAASNGYAGRKTKLLGSLLRKVSYKFASTQILSVLGFELAELNVNRKWGHRAHYSIYSSHSLEVIFNKIPQANFLQEVILPPLDTPINPHGHISLLADDAAEAALLIASCYVRQCVGKVEKLAAIEKMFGHVVLEPENLRDLHFRRHCTTNVSK